MIHTDTYKKLGLALSTALIFTVTLEASTIIHNGTTYGTVTSPYTGKVWLDRNLGASQVCTSSTDTACYGDYYQWGRNYDGHQDSTSATTNTRATNVNSAGSSFIKGSSDWASVDDAGATRMAHWSATDGSSVCPSGFNVPTITELKAETLDNGITNGATAFSNFLKLPASGSRFRYTGSLSDQGSWGNVWTRTVNGSRSHFVFFGSSGANTRYDSRVTGLSVRCIKY